MDYRNCTLLNAYGQHNGIYVLLRWFPAFSIDQGELYYMRE